MSRLSRLSSAVEGSPPGRAPLQRGPGSRSWPAARRWAAVGAAVVLAACGGGERPSEPAGVASAQPQSPADGARRMALAAASPTTGRWSDVIPLPLTPGAMANLPNGQVLMWASSGRFSFGGGGQTVTALFNPATARATERVVNETGHDMFCPGTSLLADGRLLISGGVNSERTSVYDPAAGTWSRAANLTITRGYHAHATLGDGSVLALGGSWSGGSGGKHGELWTAAGGWRRLTGVPVDPALPEDPRGIFRSDNHMWLIPTGNGRVLHAGPSAQMNWISTQGNGSIEPAGRRGDDEYSQSGNTVMYEAGKILKVGGSVAYDNRPANARAYVIDTTAGLAVRRVADMTYPRIFSNAVVLPNGEVFVVGGATQGVGWFDDFGVLVPEVWSPVTETFTRLPAMKVARNYHSTALLMPDARVLVGGQGLCGNCAGEHPNAEIFSPHYLFNADGTPAVRPAIRSAPASAVHGSTVTVTTDRAVTAFSLVRLSATTHTINNDQRRVSVPFTAVSGTEYRLALPSNPGELLPGYWMLFAINAQGVPSVAATLQVTNTGAPMLQPVADQETAVGAAVNLSLALRAQAGSVRYSASNLPPGLRLDPVTGVISGAVSQPGRWAVELRAQNSVTTSSTQMVWTTGMPSTLVRWVRLEMLEEVNGNPWASAAEIELLGADGAVLPRAGWTVSASSAENGYAAGLAVDGDPSTMWHTAWVSTLPRPPHSFTIRLAQPQQVTGFRLLPRQDGSANGSWQRWRASVSSDGSQWRSVGQGSFAFDADIAALRAGQTGVSARWLRLTALSEIQGNPWASMAEFGVLGAGGQPLPRTGWVASASSAEPDTPAAAAVDGNPGTFWHTTWRSANPVHPHSWTLDLGAERMVHGFTVLPRQDASLNGTVSRWRLQASRDGQTWSDVKEGAFAPAENPRVMRTAMLAERTALFHEVAQGRPARQSTPWGADAFPASMAVDGNFGNFTHTGGAAQDWWQVDLGQSRDLNAVRLWNRRDCCEWRLANLHVLVSASDMSGRTLAQLMADPAVWKSPRITAVPRDQLIVPTPAVGRFVRVQLAGTDYLSLSEVQVFAQDTVAEPLVVAPLPDLNVSVGEAIRLQASASGARGPTWSAAGLPAGVAIHPSSGVISGAATASGTFAVTVTAQAAGGAQGSASFTLRVSAAVPVVLPVAAPPLAAGATARYTAEGVVPAGTTWRWEFGDGSAAVTTTTPTVSKSFSRSGLYTVTVTATAPGGAAAVRTWRQVVSVAATAVPATHSQKMAWEPRAGAEPLLWVVNEDQDSVAVLDPATRQRLAEVPVGQAPHSIARAPDGRLWVSNGRSASLSVLDPATRRVVATWPMPAGSKPAGLVFAPDGSAAFVALEARGEVHRLHPQTGARLGSRVVGPDVRHLAVAADRPRLLATRFITPPLPGESTREVATTRPSPGGPVPVGGEVVVLDSATLAPVTTVVLRHLDVADGENQGAGFPNYLGAPVFTPDGTAAWVPSKLDNVRRGGLRNQQPLNFQNTVRAVSSRIDIGRMAETIAARVDHDNASLASAAAMHPTGGYLFVALQTSREVAVLDAWRGLELMRLPVGLAPDAVAVSPDGQRLVTLNFMDRSVSVHSLSRLLQYGELQVPLLGTVRTAAGERLGAQVLRGKQLFYDAKDPRLSRDSYMSCASCHADGSHDGRVWDLTSLGEGLRNTPTLRGRGGMAQGALHWSGNFDELQDFEHQIRTLAGGQGLIAGAAPHPPLGAPNAGRSTDLDALAAYLASLTEVDPNPLRAPGAALSVAATQGAALFAARCANCHGGLQATRSGLPPRLVDVGTLKPASGLRLGAPLSGLDIPSLLGVAQTAPYLHDGSAATLEAAIAAHRSDGMAAPDTTQLGQLAAFLREAGPQDYAAATPPTGGLQAEYFGGTGLSGSVLLRRVEPVDFGWGSGAPAAAVPADRFSVRWTGTVLVPSSGGYQLQTSADDGVRLWVDGRLLIDAWGDQAETARNTATLNLVAGQRVDIRLEYYENGGLAAARLRWRPPGSGGFVAIPASQLSPRR